MNSAQDQLPRVAVLGVIRGGTSMTVGLLRILGWKLPSLAPSCPPGEDRALRMSNNSEGWPASVVAELVNDLGDGVVWKDPSVALYADKIVWPRWHTVRVLRDRRKVAASMQRWAEHSQEPRDVLERRVIDWNKILDRAVPDPDLVIDADVLRNFPALTLQGISRSLLGRPASREQINAARAFIGAEPGYRCPLPLSCEVDVPGHGSGRMAAPDR